MNATIQPVGGDNELISNSRREHGLVSRDAEKRGSIPLPSATTRLENSHRHPPETHIRNDAYVEAILNSMCFRQ